VYFTEIWRPRKAIKHEMNYNYDKNKAAFGVYQSKSILEESRP
jgi:hypothetical protein